MGCHGDGEHILQVAPTPTGCHDRIRGLEGWPNHSTLVDVTLHLGVISGQTEFLLAISA